MSAQVNAEVVKATREKYGLSQRAFASLLGLGEATIVRYEKGSVPSKANANLIRAADDPKFMAGCLERDGYQLTPRQREHASQVIYAFMKLDTPEEVEEDAMTMNEIYDFTLRQEVLNEQAANIVADIMRYMVREGIEPNDTGDPLAILLNQLFEIKMQIISVVNRDNAKLDQIAGYLKYAGEFVNAILDKRGVA